MSPQLRYGEPEAAGMSAERLRHVSEVAARWVASGETTALRVLVARRGVVVLDETRGQAAPEPGAPALPPDALFPLASISKAITATAVMCLVEDGLVGLHRPVQAYLPEFAGAGKEAVMIYHLLTHTSGLRDEDVRGADVGAAGGPGDLPPPGEQHPAIAAYLVGGYATPLRRPPGAAWSYGNLNFELLGEIVRRVSGTSLADFCRARIFAPLGMDDTSYSAPESLRSRIARRYPASGPPAGAWRARLESREREEIPWAAAGVFSTARDLATFGQMYLQGGRYGAARVLGPATVAAMTRNQIPGIPFEYEGERWPEASYGLGWHVHGGTHARLGPALTAARSFDHHGFGGTYLWVDPEREVVGVILSLLDRGTQGWYSAWRGDLIVDAAMAAIEG